MAKTTRKDELLRRSRQRIRRQIAKREAEIAARKEAIVHAGLGLALATAALSPRRQFDDALVQGALAELIELLEAGQLDDAAADEFDFAAAPDQAYLLHFLRGHLRQVLEAATSLETSELVVGIRSLQAKVKTHSWQQVEEVRYWRSRLPEDG